MPKAVVLEIHTSRKLATAAAKALKRTGRARRVTTKRVHGLHRVLGKENKHWNENTASSEYPRRLRYHLGAFKTRKRALKALGKNREQCKAHYQLLRAEKGWILATFDRKAYRELSDTGAQRSTEVLSDEFANGISGHRSDDGRDGDD